MSRPSLLYKLSVSILTRKCQNQDETGREIQLVEKYLSYIFIFLGPKLIRRLIWEHLTITPFVKTWWAMVQMVTDPHLFLVDAEKLIFCGPEIDDGCKTT